jgi:mono/diheme cytochrome c family protein
MSLSERRAAVTRSVQLAGVKSRSTLWFGLLLVALCLACVPLAFAAGPPSAPGNAVAGKHVFIAFCGKCHTMRAAGSSGTLGPSLDVDRVSYARVITAIEEGVGGIQAEYVLRSLTFADIYDVAKFVVTDRAGPGVTPSSPD